MKDTKYIEVMIRVNDGPLMGPKKKLDRYECITKNQAKLMLELMELHLEKAPLLKELKRNLDKYVEEAKEIGSTKPHVSKVK